MPKHEGQPEENKLTKQGAWNLVKRFESESQRQGEKKDGYNATAAFLLKQVMTAAENGTPVSIPISTNEFYGENGQQN